MEPSTILLVAALIMSIVIHEVAHGFMANFLGDPTARLAGRLTLNPISHIDLVGSVILPLLLVISQSPLLFGYAKPVPYNPYNLRNQKWGEALVGFAGPGVNLIIAFVFALCVRFAVSMDLAAPFIEIASAIVHINILLAFFNLIPIPPADGSKVIAPFLPAHIQVRYQQFGEQLGIFGMIFLFMFIIYFGAPFYGLVASFHGLLTGL